MKIEDILVKMLGELVKLNEKLDSALTKLNDRLEKLEPTNQPKE